ncbi:MAG: hypothetical protein R3C01_00945 [Planctomycetaceae bacterium]
MNLKSLSRRSFVLAVAAMFTASPAFAQEGPVAPAAAKAPVVQDVALHDGGVVVGQVVSPAGVAQGQVNVRLVQQGKVVAVTKTNEKGQFAVADLNAGVYQVQSPQASGQFRFWNQNAAPPVAKQGVLLVNKGDVVRGQDYYEEEVYYEDGGETDLLIFGAGLGLGALAFWGLDYNDKEGS